MSSVHCQPDAAGILGLQAGEDVNDLEEVLLSATQRAFRMLDDYTFTLAKAGAKVDAVKTELLAAMTLANGNGSSN